MSKETSSFGIVNASAKMEENADEQTNGGKAA
jgi:hypothetical protein